MIVTRTPMRLSFFSGGSDLPAFYKQERGAALSVTIDKYIYVCAHKTPNIGIKTMYDSIDLVADLQQMQDGLTKEVLKHYQIDNNITIASISDILSRGSGLGSSSAFTVGLINAISQLTGNQPLRPEVLAEYACNIEMSLYPVGKQDQYAAAYGGCNLFEFDETGYVKTTSIDLNKISKLQQNLLLVYSGRGRSANKILQKQQSAMIDPTKFNLVKASRDKAYQAVQMLEQQRFDDFGDLLHQSWIDKKAVVGEITEDYFDTIYNAAITAGAIGGKLLGAGGGGFFLFYVPIDVQDQVINCINSYPGCQLYPFEFCDTGSRRQ